MFGKSDDCYCADGKHDCSGRIKKILDGEGFPPNPCPRCREMERVVEVAKRLRAYYGGMLGGVYGDMWAALDALSERREEKCLTHNCGHCEKCARCKTMNCFPPAESKTEGL